MHHLAVHEVNDWNYLKRLSLHKKPLTIFVCEFITAGGFNHAELPPSLAREGALMRDALLGDLAQLPHTIITTFDARLTAPVRVSSAVAIHKNDDVWQIWAQQMLSADAVWLIAPETAGVLKKLTALALKHGKKIIGCGPKSIEITASKLATFQVLQQAGIATIATYTLDNWPKGEGAWLAKPDDGAGCEETLYFENAEALVDWKGLQQKPFRHVIQPFQTGQAASISCVMWHGKAQMLSCNTQKIEIQNNQLKFRGMIINGMRAHWGAFERVANQIAQALPDLAGYVGVDVIVEGENIFVVEINPRLTTSYCALAEATGANPAALILSAVLQENTPWPVLKQQVVEIDV